MKFEHLPHWSEIKRLFRFGVVGALSFALFAGLYALLSRVLWTSGNRTLENFLATLVTAVFNFWAHRRITFEAHAHSSHRQLVRYLIVMFSAMALQSGLFWLGHAVFGLYDFLVIVAVAVLIPLYTYLLHKFFTFRHAA